MRRSMCLYLPYLPIERLRAIGGGPAEGGPVAVTECRGGVVHVTRCNVAAAAGGVRRGMTSAEAGALLPDLHLAADDEGENLRTLEELAVWAQAFSPVVQLERSGALLLDVTGCSPLFAGEDNLLRQALDGLHEQGFTARGAVADTPGAAWALAHAHPEAVVVTTPGRDVEDLVRLPVGSLRVDERAVAALAAVGVETVEALMYLPRASLGARFGDAVLHRLDQALGDTTEPLVPFQAPPVVRSHLRLGAATGRWDIVHEASCRTLALFCEQLTRRSVGVTRFYVTFYCPGASPVTLTISVSQATRSNERLTKLLTARLERLRLSAKTDGVMVWARETEPLDAWQEELFETRASDEREVAELVDRLSLRLGAGSVSRVELVSDHQPEKAFVYEGIEGGNNKGTKARRHGGTEGENNNKNKTHGRPLRVWGRPVEAGVVALSPDGPPSLLRFRSVEHRVAACTGPERLETGWWRGPHVRRDYFRVVSESGEAFWMFRDRCNGKWFVHGTFD